jgi:hypothetical protein
MGAQQMVALLRQDYSVKVAEYDHVYAFTPANTHFFYRKTVLDFLNLTEHDAVQRRLGRRFKRK